MGVASFTVGAAPNVSAPRVATDVTTISSDMAKRRERIIETSIANPTIPTHPLHPSHPLHLLHLLHPLHPIRPGVSSVRPHMTPLPLLTVITAAFVTLTLAAIQGQARPPAVPSDLEIQQAAAAIEQADGYADVLAATQKY